MISYVIPTRDRPAELAWTLEAINRLGDHAAVAGAVVGEGVGGAEVIIADNASSVPVSVGPSLPCGIPVRVIRLDANIGAAARNAAARVADPRSDWLVMLDDDSHPMDDGLLLALAERTHDTETAAVAAEVFVPARHAHGARHEAGGLPEVFIGCAVAIRRELFCTLGGYDEAFDYYAEEYDLSARIILAGLRIAFDPRFRVMHRKVHSGRDMGRILHRLVRNNAWVMRRYAPAVECDWHVEHTLARYRGIADAERAAEGFERGVSDLLESQARQHRRPMPRAWWDRFTGLHHARRALRAAHETEPLGTVELASPGKNEWVVKQAIMELGVRIAAFGERADTVVIATMSPGPMLDAAAELAATRPDARVVWPWLGLAACLGQAPVHVSAAGRLPGTGPVC